MFVDEVAFKHVSSAVSTGAQGATVIAGLFTEWDVELKVAAI